MRSVDAGSVSDVEHPPRVPKPAMNGRRGHHRTDAVTRALPADGSDSARAREGQTGHMTIGHGTRSSFAIPGSWLNVGCRGWTCRGGLADRLPPSVEIVAGLPRMQYPCVPWQF